MSLWKFSSRNRILFTATVLAVLIGVTGSSAALFALSPARAAEARGAANVARIVDPVDENRVTTLRGNTRPEARAEFDRGRVEATLPMTDLILVLRRSPEQQAAADAFLAAQQDTASPEYHHWLTPEEIGRQFGPSQVDIDTISHWLQNHGFAIASISKDRLFINFGGTAGQVESAFHTEIHNLLVKGKDHIANMQDPQIPEALSPVVTGVKALHNFMPHTLYHLGPRMRRDASTGKWTPVNGLDRLKKFPASGKSAESKAAESKSAEGKTGPRPDFGVSNGTTEYELIVPYDLATIYNVLPLWNAATPTDGTGQTIAIAATSNIVVGDVNTFRTATGLKAFNSTGGPTFTVKLPGTDPGTTNPNLAGDRLENTVDVEWSGAVAKNANIILVPGSANSTSSDGLFNSEQYIVNNVTAKIMNVSYGECELFLGVAGNSAYNAMWNSAALAGIAVFVASGDSGSPSCDDENEAPPYFAADYGLSVSGFTSTPYNVSVGGTDFNSTGANWGTTNNSTNLSNALGYIPEVPWNDSLVNPLVLSQLDSEVGVADDAETFANFALSDYQQGVVDQQTYTQVVEAVGGSGGVSNCTTSNGAAASTCSGGYAKPSWQTGVTGILSTDKRTIPDVSFFAANGVLGSIYLFCDTLLPDGTGGVAPGVCDYTNTTDVFSESIGGTSVSSPVMAGVMALINQQAGSTQGNPNKALYQLAATQSYGACSTESVTTSSTCYFNDIDTGNIAEVCEHAVSPNCPIETSGDILGILSGYSSTLGYDKATGLGSLNVANVVNALAPATSAPAVTLTPSSLTFAGTNVGSSAATQTIALKNTGSASLTGIAVSITGANTGSFSQTTTCGSTLAAGSTCNITVTFTPAVAGPLTASVSIADNASGSPQTAALTGTGVAVGPAVTLSPTSLSFAGTLVGTPDPIQTILLKNTGNATLTGVSISITGANTGSFTQTNTCGSTVAVNITCAITVTFDPTVGGALSAAVSITDNAADSPQSVPLTGTGAAPAPVPTLSATSLAFASSLVGSPDPTQSITLKNTGNAALTGIDVSITGANTGSFSQTNTCGSSLAINVSCAITVTFDPALGGALTAAVSIADNATGSPQTVALTGTGVVPAPIATLTPASLTFPSTTAGTSAPTQNITLANSGTAALTGIAVTIGGANASSYAQTTTCGSTLAVGVSCTITVTYTPTTFTTSGNALTATVSVADSAAGSPQITTLSGTATEAGSFSLSATNNATTAGTSSESVLTATGINGYADTINVSCVVTTSVSGTPSGDIPTCLLLTPTITLTGGTESMTDPIVLGSNAAHTVPGAVQRAALKPTGARPAGLLGAGALLLSFTVLLAVPARRKQWKSLLGVLILIVLGGSMLGTLSGCGGSSTPPPQMDPGTLPGVYTFTITGTDAAGVTAKTTFTLTVN
jgi:Pro-kumamolisin, activation domain/Abnormal spindle-like microcephaly-assoc'd, ASPM-SPD-2-Hydin